MPRGSAVPARRDALPVTAVGKPYELAPRADATRRAVTGVAGTDTGGPEADRKWIGSRKGWPGKRGVWSHLVMRNRPRPIGIGRGPVRVDSK